MDALKNRKESKLKKIKINVSEKIDQYVFADILKLSVKMKKKRKRAKKKKVKYCLTQLFDFVLFVEMIDLYIFICIYFFY